MTDLEVATGTTETEINSQTRMEVAKLVKWCLTGAIDEIIKAEEFKLEVEKEPAISGTDYSAKDGSSGGGGGSNYTAIDRFQKSVRWRKRRIKILKSCQATINAWLMNISEKDSKILELYYEKGYKIRKVAANVYMAEGSVKNRKHELIDEIAKKIIT